MASRSLLPLSLAAAAIACTGGRATAPSPAAEPPAPPAATAPATPPLTPPGIRLPDTVAPLRYAVELTIDADTPSFRGAIEIDVELREATRVVWLDAARLAVATARVELPDGGNVPATTTTAGSDDHVALVLPRPIGPGRARLHLEYGGEISDKEVSGLFRQREGDAWYAFTQFEALDARRALPCFDDPRHKTPWQITIRAREGQLAVSNAPLVALESPGDGWSTHRFAETRPLPTYLVAFAVGPFEIVNAGTAGRRDTPLRILTPRGKAAQARHAAAAMPQLLALLEAYFDTPYPYEKLDSIAIPTFFGAMENAGLVTYAQHILLADPAAETLAFQRTFATIAAHELAHQWFGNLVTLAWWDDLWLNESFATWMAAKIVDQWKPAWHADVAAVGRREQAMQADSLPSARAVRLPVASKEDVFGGGAAIFYAKGSTVLDMFESWIGDEPFRRGVRAYLQKHAWGSATAADFAAALAAASSPELAGAFATFIDRPGLPLVSARLRCDGGPPRLALSQQRFLPGAAAPPADPPWHVPVCARYEARGGSARACQLITTREAELPLPDATRCPRWVVANDGAAGYYRVAYDAALLERMLVGPAASRLALAERIAVLGDMAALVEAGAIPVADSFAMVPRLLRDRDPNLVAATIQIVTGVDRFLVPDVLRPRYARLVRRLYGARARALGWKPRRGDSDDTRLLRPQLLRVVAVQGEDAALGGEARALAESWLADRAAVPPDLVAVTLLIAGRHGDAAFHDRLLAAARAATERGHRVELFRAMAAARDPALVARNMALAIGDEFDFRDAAVLLQRPFEEPATRDAAWRFFVANFDAIVAKLPSFYARAVAATAAAFCDPAMEREARAFLEPRMAKIVGGAQALEQSLAQLRACSAYREAQQPSVRAFLERQ
jgi:alanyl aminopeptidase